MINDMLTEVNQKYDLETMRCKDFFNMQCQLMEICRQDISFANAACARARERILALLCNFIEDLKIRHRWAIGVCRKPTVLVIKSIA